MWVRGAHPGKSTFLVSASRSGVGRHKPQQILPHWDVKEPETGFRRPQPSQASWLRASSPRGLTSRGPLHSSTFQCDSHFNSPEHPLLPDTKVLLSSHTTLTNSPVLLTEHRSMHGQQSSREELKSQEGWQLGPFTFKATDVRVAAPHWELPLV